MKCSSVIACAVLAAMGFAPVLTATPEMDKAVQLASRSSKAGLDAICQATYQAVKADPDNADKILEAVLGQRSNWKASEVYAIFRSVLLARPDLLKEIDRLVTLHRSGAHHGKNSADSADGSDEASENGGGANGVGADGAASGTGGQGLVGAVSQTTSLSPMLASMVNVLYDAGLMPGVAEEALNMTIAAVAGTYAYAYESSFEHLGDNTNMEGPSLDNMLEFIPTPDDVTKH